MSAGRDGDVLLQKNSRPAPAGQQEQQLLIRYSFLLPDSHEICVRLVLFVPDFPFSLYLMFIY